jgi:hypothetical protein
MENLKLTQANFTAGEIAPTLLARDDIQQYAAGASKLRNVVVTPHGGVRRRPGLRYDAELQKGSFFHWVFSSSSSAHTIDYTTSTVNSPFASGAFGTATDILVVLQKSDFPTVHKALCPLDPATDYSISGDIITFSILIEDGDSVYVTSNKATGSGDRDTTYNEDILDSGSSDIAIQAFSFSTEQEYLVVITEFRISIYRDEGAGLYVLQKRIASPMSGGSIDGVTFCQSLDTLLIFHKYHCTQRLQRTGGHTLWARSEWPYDHVPEYSFKDQYSPGGTHSTAPSSVALNHIERIRYSFGSDSVYTLYVNGEETAEIEFDVAGTGSEAANASALQAGIEGLESFSAGDITVAHDAGDEYLITFGGDASGKDFAFLQGNDTFSNTSNVVFFSTKQKGKGEVESAFSVRRGYPRCGTFFAGRLWVGGAISLPQSIFSSRSGVYEDFNSTETYADYGIFYTMDTDDVAAIYNIYAGRHLTLLTSSAEFYDPTTITDVPTPETFFTRRTTRRGSLEGLPAFDIQGGLVFVERYGKSITEIVYAQENESYNSVSLSTLAPHLISTPVDMAFRTATSVEEADYLYVVNSDGTLAIFNTLRDERVNAWSLLTTTGDFRNVAVVGSDTLFVVRRSVGGVDKFFLEHFDDDLYMDSADSSPSGVSSTTSLAHLTSENCDLLLDGNLQDQVVAPYTTTTSSWQAGLPFPDVSGAGLGWQTWIQTLPYQSGPDSVSLRGSRQGVADVFLRVHNTSSLSVRSGESTIYPIAFRSLGSVLETSVPVYSGVVEKRGLQGFEEASQLSVIQTESLPMHVLGITQKVTI